MNGALSGLRVLDLSRILAGPWCAQLLGDLGAEVIKIERPGQGDDTRGWGPPFLAGEQGEGDAAYFLCANRNKKSVTIDFTQTEGQDIVRQLVASADILVENFKVGGLRKFGLDYDSLRAINPRLIYCSITGFGQDGPYAQRAGYDFLIQAMGGLMSFTGRKEGEPGSGPQKVGVALTDILTGLYGGVGILAALAHRERTGQGQHIDLALLDVHVACLANQASNYLVSGKAPAPLGNAHPNIVPYQDFPTSDGHMVIAVGNDSQFVRLCEVLGDAATGLDPRFATNRERVANRDVLIPALAARTRQSSTADWVNRLEVAGVPCGPINNLEEVFADPQIVARGMRIDMPHPTSGEAPGVANPLRLSETPVDYRDSPPILGAHTHDILRNLLHFDAAHVERLKDDGII